MRIVAKRAPPKRDFSALKDNTIGTSFDRVISGALSAEQTDPECAEERLQRLNNAMQMAIKTLLTKKRQSPCKRYVSDHTKELIADRGK